MNDIIDAYVDYASSACDAPSIYHLACGYWIISSVLGRFVRVVTSYAPEGLMPNLWVLLIGPSRIARKTTAMKLAEGVVKQVDEKILMPASFTPEALYQLFNSVQEGDAFAWVKDEFGGFFQMLQKRYMAGLRELLNSLYVGKGEVRYLKSGVLKIPDNLYITTLGTLPTPPRQYITDEDFYSGFMNRWILAYAERREKTIPITHRDDRLILKRNDIVATLKSVVKGASGILPVSFSSSAAKMLSDYDYVVEQELLRIEKTNPASLWKCYYAETPMFLIKMSVLRRIARETQGFRSLIIVVEEDDVRRASEDLKQFVDSARKVVEDVETSGRPAPVVTEEKGLTKIYDIIRSSGASGVSKSELLLKTMMRVDVLNTMLLTLVEQDRVVAVKVVSGKGRPQLRFFAAEHRSEAEMVGQVLTAEQLRAILK
jgi:hypothetical protein